MAWKAIERVGLVEAAKRKVAGYSKGMRQRIRLAQAIAHEPSVLVLDEPLNGLDPMARAEVIDLFRELADGGLHVIVSSHILHEVDLISDQVVLINGGYIVAEGEIGDVRDEMEEEHPMQVLVRCDRPSLLASRVFEQDHVVEARICDDGRSLLVRTRDADSFHLAAQRDRARQRPRDRGGGAGRRRRQRGLPVPDRREWRQVVSEIITSAAPATRAGLPWGQWWTQLRAIVRLELRKGFRRPYRPAPAGARAALHPGAADGGPARHPGLGRHPRRDPVLRRALPGVHPADRDLPRLHRDLRQPDPPRDARPQPPLLLPVADPAGAAGGRQVRDRR